MPLLSTNVKEKPWHTAKEMVTTLGIGAETAATGPLQDSPRSRQSRQMVNSAMSVKLKTGMEIAASSNRPKLNGRLITSKVKGVNMGVVFHPHIFCEIITT